MPALRRTNLGRLSESLAKTGKPYSVLAPVFLPSYHGSNCICKFNLRFVTHSRQPRHEDFNFLQRLLHASSVLLPLTTNTPKPEKFLQNSLAKNNAQYFSVVYHILAYEIFIKNFPRKSPRQGFGAPDCFGNADRSNLGYRRVDPGKPVLVTSPDQLNLSSLYRISFRSSPFNRRSSHTFAEVGHNTPSPTIPARNSIEKY